MPKQKTPVTIRNSETFQINSVHVGDVFQISVQVPRSYGTTEQTYPVLYILDSDDAFDLLSGILHLHTMDIDEHFPEMILVGIGYGADVYEREKNHRDRDYPPTQAAFPLLATGSDSEKEVAGGGAKKLLRFIRKELIPKIETEYRADPAERLFAGISFGGLFGAYVLFHQTDTFNRYLLSSPSLWWDERITLEYEKLYAKKFTDLPVHLYLSAGRKEEGKAEIFQVCKMITNLKELAAALRGRNYPSLRMKYAIEQGGHTSSQPAALSKGLMYLAKKMNKTTHLTESVLERKDTADD